jgi:hypothetical protein
MAPEPLMLQLLTKEAIKRPLGRLAALAMIAEEVARALEGCRHLSHLLRTSCRSGF